MDPAIEQLRDVLKEAFEGPYERWSYFTDGGREAGFFGTLERLSAAEASRSLGGTTIAAHVHHVVFGLDASAAWIRGERSPRDWKESWSVERVDEAAWSELRDRLRRGYEDLRLAIETHAATDRLAMGGAIGAIAHVAYHLGAIRQKIALARP